MLTRPAVHSRWKREMWHYSLSALMRFSFSTYLLFYVQYVWNLTVSGNYTFIWHGLNLAQKQPGLHWQTGGVIEAVLLPKARLLLWVHHCNVLGCSGGLVWGQKQAWSIGLRFPSSYLVPGGFKWQNAVSFCRQSQTWTWGWEAFQHRLSAVCALHSGRRALSLYLSANKVNIIVINGDYL